jgi:iron complex transport system substrate-binding protein
MRGDAEPKVMRRCGEKKVSALEIDEITGAIVDSAVKLHSCLGPGLLESVYEKLFTADLIRRGLIAERQKAVSFEFDGIKFEEGLKVDLLVNNIVVVEIKSLERLLPVHTRQVLTYLRVLELPVGLLINFGAPTLKQGLQRIVNQYQPVSSTLRVNQDS